MVEGCGCLVECASLCVWAKAFGFLHVCTQMSEPTDLEHVRDGVPQSMHGWIFASIFLDIITI